MSIFLFGEKYLFAIFVYKICVFSGFDTLINNLLVFCFAHLSLLGRFGFKIADFEFWAVEFLRIVIPILDFSMFLS